MDRELKRSIILENYQYPNKKDTDDPSYIKLNSRNVSCIDNLDLYLKFNDKDILEDAFFNGEACVISTASANILLNLLIGKNKDEISVILENYLKMINEEEYDKDVIKELNVFDDVYKQPSRITCATLAANGIKKYLENK